jgi:hypothetical protein
MERWSRPAISTVIALDWANLVAESLQNLFTA